MTIIEIVAVVFSFVSVWLSVKKNRWLWPVGIIGILAYMYLFFDVKLYADFGLQIVFFLQSVYGWWYWMGGKKKVEPPITKLSIVEFSYMSGIFIVLTAPLSIFLKNYTDASLPLFDSIASVTSLIANWLLAKKKIENWILWISVDALYVGIFIYKDLYLSAVLYGLFFFMAIRGYIEWKRSTNNEKV